MNTLTCTHVSACTQENVHSAHGPERLSLLEGPTCVHACAGEQSGWGGTPICAHTGTRTWHSHAHITPYTSRSHTPACAHTGVSVSTHVHAWCPGDTPDTHTHTHKHEKAHTHSPQGSPRAPGPQATPGCLCAVEPSQRRGICRTGLIPGAERSLLITSSAPGCCPCLAPTPRCLRPLHTHLSSMKSQGGHQEPLSH